MLMIESYDSTFNASDFDIFKDDEPQVIAGILNVNFTKVKQYIDVEFDI
jgi:hypothetical protein